jgi:hypothetical protein
MIEYRGSRRHMLEWVEQPAFLEELRGLLFPVPVTFSSETTWLPLGRAAPRQARLETFGPVALPGAIDWPALSQWWLPLPNRGTTLTWDLAATCELDGRRGLVLVEAKGNWTEVSTAGKVLRDGYAIGIGVNHDRIVSALARASAGLSKLAGPVSLTTTSHYQLARRLAFAWKLASLGLPVALVYLGFIGDEGISDTGESFATDSAWSDAFRGYCGSPGIPSLFEHELRVGETPLWLIARSRPVLSQSPPRAVEEVEVVG